MVRAMDLAILRHVAEELIPFNKFLGVRVLSLSPGRVEMEVPWRDELIGDPLKGAIHGGVISTLADTAGGIAVWGALENPVARVSTIDLRIDYLRPGRPESLIAEAVAVRVGRTVGVADVRLFHASSREVLIATGKGVYAVKVPKNAPLPQ
jgi:uncharacterized protein (TIGR00369 family)